MRSKIYGKSNTLTWFLCCLLSSEKPTKESYKINNKKEICTAGYIIFSAKSYIFLQHRHISSKKQSVQDSLGSLDLQLD